MIIAGVVLVSAWALSVIFTDNSRIGSQWVNEQERWFMPGNAGYESGQRQSPLGSAAFSSRALGMTNPVDGGEWARHNRLTPRLEFSHNLAEIFPPKLFDESPEFFPMEGGRRLRPPEKSVWWNPDLGREDVAAYAAEKAGEYFDAHPDEMGFAMGVNDGLIFGESPETTALVTPLRWFRGRPDYTNLVFTFMNRVAADFGKTKPNKYLGALAYYWTENAPDFPVHAQVIPFLTADRAQGYDPAFRTEERALQVRWALRHGTEGSLSDTQLATLNAGRPSPRDLKRNAGQGFDPSGISPRLGLYDYLYGRGFLIPRFHPHLIADNLRQARRLGFTDYFAEMNPNWGLDGPQPWLVAQLLQDPEQSADRLLAEYYRRYFKETAFLMKHFYSRCEEQWLTQPGSAYWLKHFRNESQATIFPSAVCAELRALLGAALQTAKSDLVRSRVKQVSDAFGVTERFVAMQEARDKLVRLALEATSAAPLLSVQVDKFTEARKEFENYTKALQQTQPTLVAPVYFVDYLTDDPVAMARARLHVQQTELVAEENNDQINGYFQGLPNPVRKIAGLTYSLSLPEPWQSRVEPAEHHMMSLTLGVVRIAGTKDATLFQWVQIPRGALAMNAAVDVRGHVSNSGVVKLTLGWLDAEHRHLGLTVVRLPEGEWPQWQTLIQAAEPPKGAVWVGIGARIQHQEKSDWVELRNFTLRAAH
ncbi:MAG: DUF4838 domain-containing protein [Opitutaceae bacterium]|nr:DUF4838 domain-containing protein [Opitutaceae bacterium]